MYYDLDISVGLEEAFVVIDSVSDEVVEVLSESVDDLLGLVEETQIHKYTQEQYPSKPSGSTYVRTFTLRSSSRKHRTGPMSGEWYADTEQAPYAPDVIGTLSEQADIHRGRWLATEQVEAVVIDKAPAVIAARLEKRFKQ